MLANAKDYPTTLLPGATINAPNPELLKTVSVCDSSDAQIDTLYGVVVCVQQNYLTQIREEGTYAVMKSLLKEEN